jgi:hypothetical protein
LGNVVQASLENTKGGIKKTAKTGVRTEISSQGKSVQNDLQDHFSVLNELATKLEEYYAMPTIPVEIERDFQR